MNKAMRAALAFALGALVHPCAVGKGAPWHGRAGQATGAERVEALGVRAGTAQPSQQAAFDLPPGRAGGAAAALPVPDPRLQEAIAADLHYGRAGGPVTLGGTRPAAGQGGSVRATAPTSPAR
jgi:hypothetical protein